MYWALSMSGKSTGVPLADDVDDVVEPSRDSWPLPDQSKGRDSAKCSQSEWRVIVQCVDKVCVC